MSYLALAESMSAARFQTMVNHESGLIGISETSADVRDLLEREPPAMHARAKRSKYFATRLKSGLALLPPRSAVWTRWYSPAASAKTPRGCGRNLRGTGISRHRTE